MFKLIIILLILIIIFKFDVHLQKNEITGGIYIIWKTIKKDANSGEYYQIYLSKRVF